MATVERDRVVAALRSRAVELEGEVAAHRASTARRESNSVREKKRAQARELLRVADRFASGDLP